MIGHGGPTTATKATLDPQVQYWTSRGFAVADVNYGGSSGYGREYRQRLNGQWGIVDVDDTINAARYLVELGKADPDRLIIRGGSAGGYTTLAALTFHPGEFKAGRELLRRSATSKCSPHDTHKFESRYLDTLIGPYPGSRDRYRERSPIHFVDRLSCALILFQGLEDKVVPPNQSEMMADAVQAEGVARRLPRVRGRAARVSQGLDDHPEPRGRALLLRRGVRVSARGPDRARPDRQPPMTITTNVGPPRGGPHYSLKAAPTYSLRRPRTAERRPLRTSDTRASRIHRSAPRAGHGRDGHSTTRATSSTPALTLDPTDLATTTPALFMTRWITHYCAPIFVFLAGVGAYLQQSRAA